MMQPSCATLKYKFILQKNLTALLVLPAAGSLLLSFATGQGVANEFATPPGSLWAYAQQVRGASPAWQHDVQQCSVATGCIGGIGRT
jgi:hypothetical protein